MSTASAVVLEAIDGIIQEVRTGFFFTITQERAVQIAAYELVDNPLNTEQILRVEAAIAEANWTAYLVAGRHAMYLLDGTVEARQNWNDEPLVRDATAINAYRRELKSQVDSTLARLADPVKENGGEAKCSLNGPDTPYLISENFPGLSGGYGTSVIGGF
jgi:hypothetical protein